jgi:hypothetical protein
VALVSAALPKGVGEYQMHAAIAAVHDEAESADETDLPSHYRTAAGRTTSVAERDYLLTRGTSDGEEPLTVRPSAPRSGAYPNRLGIRENPRADPYVAPELSQRRHSRCQIRM